MINFIYVNFNKIEKKIKMSKISKDLLKNIKYKDINKKLTFNCSMSSNESDECKPINDNKIDSLTHLRKNNSLCLFKLKERSNSITATGIPTINYSSKSIIPIGKRSINKYINKTYKSNSLLYTENRAKKQYGENKENKQNQVNLIFNNSVLNNCYNNQMSKVNTQFLKLKKAYNPHHNYYKIVKDEKTIINELLSQTNNNFNNMYKIIYSNPDSKKREDILKIFNNIRRNKNKNIDRKSQIKVIAMKEFNKDNKMNITDYKNKKNVLNKALKFPTAFNMKTFVSQKNKIKIKTMKMIDEISKNNNCNNNCTTLYFENKYIHKDRNNFFKTIPKNKKLKSKDKMKMIN